MSRTTYSTPLLLCLCALSFIAGRFIQQIPGLPESNRGFSKAAESTPSLRRQTIELQQPPVLLNPANQTKRAEYPTYDEALEATGMFVGSGAVTAGESGESEQYTQPFQLLSWYPRTYVFPRFLNTERAEHFVKLAKARLAPSSLAFKKGDTADTTKDVRTSQGTFISRNEDKEGVLAWIEDRLAQLTGLPANHGEPFNVLRYQLTQHYDSHYDVFDPESYGPQASQRMATVLIYLSAPEEGGETVFPLEGEHGLDRLPTINYRSCDQGLKYKPRSGDALLFWSIHPNGSFDKHALHGGCPVTKGEKWVATKWIRDKCFGCS